MVFSIDIIAMAHRLEIVAIMNPIVFRVLSHLPAFLFFMLRFVGAILLPIQCLLMLIRNRREKSQSKKQIREAIETMEGKGLVTRKTEKTSRNQGKYRPKNWASKWIAYSRSLPISSQRYQMSGRELPPLPKQDD